MMATKFQKELLRRTAMVAILLAVFGLLMAHEAVGRCKQVSIEQIHARLKANKHLGVCCTATEWANEKTGAYTCCNRLWRKLFYFLNSLPPFRCFTYYLDILIKSN